MTGEVSKFSILLLADRPLPPKQLWYSDVMIEFFSD